MKKDSKIIEAILTRNVSNVIERESLTRKLYSSKRLRVKLGADPTAPDLHLGHAVLLWKLREFQEAGHKIVFIIGDFTAAVGDPSGRSQARPVLSLKEIASNAKTYFNQVGKILDMRKIEVHRNSEWLSKLRLRDWLKLLQLFTVSRILEREDFQKRLKGNQEVWLHEVMYPLLQAYDSVAVRADVELGAGDQLFNLLTGRALQEKMGRPPQDVLVTDYVVGLDGAKKMSKSVGNYIGIAEKPSMMFGKAMSLPDELIVPYFRLTTRRGEDEIKVFERRLSAGDNPRDVKLDLAFDITALYHGPKAALRARAEFIKVFSKKEIPSSMGEQQIAEGSYEAAALLLTLGLAKSRSEARRLIEQGGAEAIPLRGLARKLEDPREMLSIADRMVIRVGKTRFIRLRAASRR